MAARLRIAQREMNRAEKGLRPGAQLGRDGISAADGRLRRASGRFAWRAYVKDLGQKVHRGLEGRIRDGRSGGGICFGYNVVRELDCRDYPIYGARKINETEASIVRRIFTAFAAGRSPRAIAIELNAEHVTGPHGKNSGPPQDHACFRPEISTMITVQRGGTVRRVFTLKDKRGRS